MSKRERWMVVAGVLVSVAAAPAVAQPRYRIVDLGTLGGRVSHPLGLNERGEVVGQSETPPGTDGAPTHAFLYRGGALFDLGALPTDAGPSFSQARDVNLRGQVAGESLLQGGAVHAVVWERGRIRDLGVLVPGALFSTATAINDWGDVAGTALAVPGGSDGPYRAFLHRRGAMVDLGTLGGDSHATDINNWGQVVGFSVAPGGRARAVLWSGGRIHDLGTLGGNQAQAAAINDLGQVVGASETGDGVDHAFLYERGRMIDLGTLGGTRSFAAGINLRGDIVGHALNGDGVIRPFLRVAGVMYDLTSVIEPSPGWQVFGATEINASRWIIGDCAFQGWSRGCLLVPVPQR